MKKDRIVIFMLMVFLLLSLFIGSDCKKEPPPIIPPDTTDVEPDSTTHNIFWQIDTIGKWQSRLFDVWGTDPNNVYAVGFVYTSDTANEGTSVMHWDGTQWTTEPFWVGDVGAIYGFSKNDIWVGGFNGAEAVIGHWNGTVWERILPGKDKDIHGIWGTSSNNLYMVGGGGMILRFNGSSWSQMSSGTNIFLSDIWGFSANQIYASGYDETLGRGVLLYYNGEQWQTLYDRIWNGGDPTDLPAGQTPSVWGYDSLDVYVWTPSGTFLRSQTVWTRLEPPTDRTFIYKIRGLSQKNIFMTGPFSLIIHWNGKNWFRYDQFYRKPNGDNLYSAFVTKNQIFIVGFSETSRGIIYRGTMNNY